MENSFTQMELFFQRATDDHRIGPLHVSLYMSIFFCHIKNNCEEPVGFNSSLVMRQAKISSRATYTRCIHDLSTYGYIRYVSSNDPYCGCRVYLKIN